MGQVGAPACTLLACGTCRFEAVVAAVAHAWFIFPGGLAVGPWEAAAYGGRVPAGVRCFVSCASHLRVSQRGHRQGFGRGPTAVDGTFEPGSARIGRRHSVGLDLGHYLLEVGPLKLLLPPLGGHRACHGPHRVRALWWTRASGFARGGCIASTQRVCDARFCVRAQITARRRSTASSTLCGEPLQRTSYTTLQLNSQARLTPTPNLLNLRRGRLLDDARAPPHVGISEKVSYDAHASMCEATWPASSTRQRNC